MHKKRFSRQVLGQYIRSLHIAIAMLASLSCASIGVAQTPPGSDIWIGKLDITHKKPISDLIQLTSNASYTNQPYFFDNSRLYYTQMHGEGDSVQTDIHLFNIALGQDENLTQSPESEYSATPVPGKSTFSVIRVNSDGKQELWELDARGNPLQHFVPAIEPVGYQVWLDAKTLLLFVLGEPHTLQKVDINTKKSEDKSQSTIIDTNIGASLYRFKRTTWFFYSKNYDNIADLNKEPDNLVSEVDQGNWLYAFNNETGKKRRVARLPQTSEYFAVTPSGYVLTSDGNNVLSRRIVEEDNKLKPIGKWQEIDLKQKECQKGVSRMGVSPDGSMIALVCNRQD